MMILYVDELLPVDAEPDLSIQASTGTGRDDIGTLRGVDKLEVGMFMPAFLFLPGGIK